MGPISGWVNKYNGEARFWLKYYATSKFPPKKVSTPSIVRETAEGILRVIEREREITVAVVVGWVP